MSGDTRLALRVALGVVVLFIVVYGLLLCGEPSEASESAAAAQSEEGRR